MSHSLSFFFAVALSFAASAAFAQTQPQRAAMALGVAQSGVLRAIDVVDGAHVEAGQVLVELDCEPLRKEIDVRAANLAAADAVYSGSLTARGRRRCDRRGRRRRRPGARRRSARDARSRPRVRGRRLHHACAAPGRRARFPRRRRGARGRAQEARAAQGRLALRGHRRGQGSARQRRGLSRRGQGRTRSVLGAGRPRQEPSRFLSPSASSSRPTRRRRSFN